MPPRFSIPRSPAIPIPKKNWPGSAWRSSFCQGLSEKLGVGQARLNEHLDLVAIGSIADIVPLLGENRILASAGLERLRTSEKPGVRALIDLAGVRNKKLGSSDIVFGLAPRINAVGRMGDAERGVRLFLTDDMDDAREMAKVLDSENRSRREVDVHTLEEAREAILHDINLDERWTIVLHSENWHPGVLGIVASRIIEEHYRPTVLISFDENGEGKGSARSVANFHIHDALKRCGDFLDAFGGHKYAAGLQVRSASSLDEFIERFDEVAHEMMSESDLVPEISGRSGNRSYPGQRRAALSPSTASVPMDPEIPGPCWWPATSRWSDIPKLSAATISRCACARMVTRST